MNDDLTLLASAYLDDDVTSDERARVQADPELLAEVDRLRAVRAVLADVGVASIARREEHLAAALNAWDRLPESERNGSRRDATPLGIDAAAVAGAASVSAPTPIAARRRTRSPRWLMGAAAALVLVLAGGVALQLSSADNDTASSSAANADTAETAAAALSTSKNAGDAAEPPAPAAADQLSEPGGGSELDTGIDNAAPPADAGGLDQLETPADLADFASVAAAAPVAPDVPAATSAPVDDPLSVLPGVTLPDCPGIDIIVGPAMYRSVEVLVGIDKRSDTAIAYRVATCDEVARVRLP